MNLGVVFPWLLAVVFFYSANQNKQNTKEDEKEKKSKGGGSQPKVHGYLNNSFVCGSMKNSFWLSIVFIILLYNVMPF